MKVRCVREFHSKAEPGADYGVLGREYHVLQARWSNIWNDPEPLHYLLRELPNVWVNCERFERVSPL